MRGWAFEGGDPELVTEVLLGTYFWWALRARDGNLPSDTDDLHRRFVTLLMRAVQPRAAPIEFPVPMIAPAPHDRAGEPLSDALWAALEPVLPPAPVGRGGRWRNHRQVLSAIAWKCRTGAAWRDLPKEYGSWQTAWNRLRRWGADGTWERLVTAAHSAGDQVAREAAWMAAPPGSMVPDGRRTSENR
jgi:putative transposase